ncbi:hypothetical protein CVT25_000110 [Psilocybe cyanescens]|uniref:Uncharacterized protein n=1 Tax=Psilocybe cyanescens TaxID=93625 RepID=A0A409XQH7_PSICY|nr:hypothetical protein CVT25_000110 [Psilocybe cyanescens]
MPRLLRRIASSFTRSSETNQLETPIFDTPLADQTVEELETLRKEILTTYNKTIDQKETAKQNYRPAAAKSAHYQARSLRLNSSASTVTDTHLDILSEIAATTQRTTNTLTPIIEELTTIFSTTPVSPTPQVNHMETIKATEVMDFTPSEA